TARERGLKVIIAGAGGAAHLPGMVASQTTLPVIGVPIQSRALDGMDSLLSIVQMPGGVPTATMAIGKAGAKNAGLFAAQIYGVQLCLMMAIEGKYMGYHVVVLDTTQNCPTAQVADKHFVAAYDDLEAIKELTEYSDVITYEFENVDLEAATYIEKAGKLPQ